MVSDPGAYYYYCLMCYADFVDAVVDTSVCLTILWGNTENTKLCRLLLSVCASLWQILNRFLNAQNKLLEFVLSIQQQWRPVNVNDLLKSIHEYSIELWEPDRNQQTAQHTRQRRFCFILLSFSPWGVPITRIVLVSDTRANLSLCQVCILPPCPQGHDLGRIYVHK